MASNEPYSTIDELPDFDIEFPEPAMEAMLAADQDNFPYHELDDIVDAQWEDQQGLDHPINWLG